MILFDLAPFRLATKFLKISHCHLSTQSPNDPKTLINVFNRILTSLILPKFYISFDLSLSFYLFLLFFFLFLLDLLFLSCLFCFWHCFLFFWLIVPFRLISEWLCMPCMLAAMLCTTQWMAAAALEAARAHCSLQSAHNAAAIKI